MQAMREGELGFDAELTGSLRADVRPVSLDAKGHHQEHRGSIESDAERRDGGGAETGKSGRGHADYDQRHDSHANGYGTGDQRRSSRPQQEQSGQYRGGDHREKHHLFPVSGAATEQVEEERHGRTGETLSRDEVFQAPQGNRAPVRPGFVAPDLPHPPH